MKTITIPEIKIWTDKPHRNIRGTKFYAYKSKWTVFRALKYRTFSIFTPLFWVMFEFTYTRA